MKNKNLLLKVFTTSVLYVYCIKNEFMATAILVNERDFEIYNVRIINLISNRVKDLKL